jgi:hypothetical protein
MTIEQPWNDDIINQDHCLELQNSLRDKMNVYMGAIEMALTFPEAKHIVDAMCAAFIIDGIFPERDAILSDVLGRLAGFTFDRLGEYANEHRSHAYLFDLVRTMMPLCKIILAVGLASCTGPGISAEIFNSMFIKHLVYAIDELAKSDAAILSVGEGESFMQAVLDDQDAANTFAVMFYTALNFDCQAHPCPPVMETVIDRFHEMSPLMGLIAQLEVMQQTPLFKRSGGHVMEGLLMGVAMNPESATAEIFLSCLIEYLQIAVNADDVSNLIVEHFDELIAVGTPGRSALVLKMLHQIAYYDYLRRLETEAILQGETEGIELVEEGAISDVLLDDDQSLTDRIARRFPFDLLNHLIHFLTQSDPVDDGRIEVMDVAKNLSSGFRLMLHCGSTAELTDDELSFFAPAVTRALRELLEAGIQISDGLVAVHACVKEAVSNTLISACDMVSSTQITDILGQDDAVILCRIVQAAYDRGDDIPTTCWVSLMQLWLKLTACDRVTTAVRDCYNTWIEEKNGDKRCEDDQSEGRDQVDSRILG